MVRFQIYESKDEGPQCWRWRLIDTNGQIIAVSEEPFHKGNIVGSIKKIKSEVTPTTPIIEEGAERDGGGYCFEYFQSQNNDKWYWRLKAKNGECMAIGGEGFSSKQSVERSIDNVKNEIYQGPRIEYENEEDDPKSMSEGEEDESGNKTTGIAGS